MQSTLTQRQRVPGYYWVREHNQPWQVAHWENQPGDRRWTITGWDAVIYEDFPQIVEQPLTPPNTTE